jgi:hypothetical protein
MSIALLKKSLIELDCDRTLLAKIHPFDLHENKNVLVFSSIFEELKNYKNLGSIKEYVKNIPYNVLQLEFGDDKDFIVVANKLEVNPEEIKCIDHLDKLGCEVIINQLLYSEDYVWGILSFQYKNCPYYVKGTNIENNWKTTIIQYKNKIQKMVSCYE